MHYLFGVRKNIKKSMMRYFFAFLLLVQTSFTFAYTPKDGDIIFHTSRSAQSLDIQQATHSKYSHMGIIFIENGNPYVFEAASKVKYTPIQEWINRGIDKKYTVKRLNTVELSDNNIKQLKTTAKNFANKPYDILFSWSDDAIYCSELVWKIYDRALNIQIGELQQLKEFDLSSSVVKNKLKERYGNKISYTESVIAPSAMFDSALLSSVE